MDYLKAIGIIVHDYCGTGVRSSDVDDVTDYNLNQSQPRTASQTEQIISRLIVTVTGSNFSHPDLNESYRKSYEKLLRVVKIVMERYGPAFQGMYLRLQIDQTGTGLEEKIISIGERLLCKDGYPNWGRLIALIAFVASFVKTAVEKGQMDEERVSNISSSLSQYIDQQLTVRLKHLGGWEGLNEQLQPEVDYEGLMLRGLGTLAGCGLVSMALIAGGKMLMAS